MPLHEFFSMRDFTRLHGCFRYRISEDTLGRGQEENLSQVLGRALLTQRKGFDADKQPLRLNTSDLDLGLFSLFHSHLNLSHSL